MASLSWLFLGAAVSRAAGMRAAGPDVGAARRSAGRAEAAGRRLASLAFRPLLAGASLRDRLLACAGALAGIALTALVAAWTLPAGATPLVAASMGASAVLMFAVPASPLAQPWPVLGGNIVSALVGIAIAGLVPSPALAAGAAVGAAILVMSLLRCLHPPGGGTALIAVAGGGGIEGMGYAFAFLPVGLNALTLVVIGWCFHLFSGHSYPHRPVPVAGHRLTLPDRSRFRSEDIDSALEELGETFDVSLEDLDLLFRSAERHAAERRSLEVQNKARAAARVAGSR